ncbi:MAG: ion transporter [Clostridiales bacterium]|nr:ion transporter [Clostridiales bacterium]
MRKRIFEIIEKSNGDDRLSAIYDYSMMAIIAVSLIPMAFKETNAIFTLIDYTAAIIFSVDYLLRLITADFKVGKGAASFFLYPFTPMAIIDLLCILPTFTALAGGFRILKIFRLLRTFRVFRTLKMFRYSRSIEIILNVIQSQKNSLVAVGTLAVGYVLISALIVFNVEPDTFDTFFDAIYWATVSLTTVGYGDIYPVTVVGKIVAMMSSFIGIAIIALPSGIITAGYMSELSKQD